MSIFSHTGCFSTCELQSAEVMFFLAYFNIFLTMKVGCNGMICCSFETRLGSHVSEIKKVISMSRSGAEFCVTGGSDVNTRQQHICNAVLLVRGRDEMM